MSGSGDREIGPVAETVTVTGLEGMFRGGDVIITLDALADILDIDFASDGEFAVTFATPAACHILASFLVEDGLREFFGLLLACDWLVADLDGGIGVVCGCCLAGVR